MKKNFVFLLGGIVGQRQAVYMAIHRSDVDKRNTVFADRIVAYLNREVQKRAC